jgi:hypothetical protein
VITGWLFRLVVVFAVVAVILFDAGSAVVNFFSLDSEAEEIAVSLATAVTNHEVPTDNPQVLKDRAKKLAEAAGARLVRAEIDAEGVIFIRLRRTANTLVLGRVSALERWTRATADARAGSS